MGPVGLGIVAFAAFFACVFYFGWAGGEVGEGLADGILFLLGGAGYLTPIALFGAGAPIVLRPMLPAVHPFKTGALCLFAALTLGLAAGSLGLGPGDAPRDGFFDPSYLRDHGGLVGESLFWSSAKLFSEAGSHILFVFLLLAGVLLLTGASIAGVVQATRDAATTTTQRVRRRHRRRRERPLPGDPMPVRAARARGLRADRARHPRRGARARRLRALPRPLRRRARAGARARRSDWDEPEPEVEPSRRAEPTRSPTPRPEPEAGAAHPDGQPPLCGHRGRRPPLPDAEALLPEALQRGPEGPTPRASSAPAAS